MMELWSKNLLLKYDPYKKDQVIFESSTPGTYNVELLADGKYEVYCIGGGAGAAHTSERISGNVRYSRAGGGSGSGFVGIIKLKKSTLSCVVGNGGAPLRVPSTTALLTGYPGGDSKIQDFVISYGAPASVVRSYPSYCESYAAPIPEISIVPLSQELNIAGNVGQTGTGSSGRGYAGGASVYNGYGTGGTASADLSAHAGTAGYVKIVYKGK